MTCPDCEYHKRRAQIWRHQAYKLGGKPLPWEPNMTDLREAAKDLLDGVEAAIKAGDWKVDGACDPDLAIKRLRQALAQEQKPVAWMYTSHYKGNEWFITRYQSELTTYKADKVQPLYTAPPSIEAAVLAEREACAKVCDEIGMLGNGELGQFWSEKCADAIRARGKK